MKVWKPLGLGIAAVAVTLSLINASWIAPDPKGQLVLVARRGLAPQFPREAAANGGCTATRIAPPGDNLFLENSLPSLYKAMRLGAGALEVDLQRTRDGQMVLFRDPTLECHTNGRGRIGDHDLAALKMLDIGYGYTADGGKTYPLRGRGVGGMPTVEEALREVRTSRFIFRFVSNDPAEADALAAAFARAEMKIDTARHSFTGDPAVLARVKALVPGAWTYGKAELGGCLGDYLRIGWTSFVPASCRNTTVFIPVDKQWAIWGWPNRFLARMAGAGSKVMVLGPERLGEITGLDAVEQIDDVPRDFRGYLWIEDFSTVGRAVQR